MPNRADHIAGAAEAVTAFQRRRGTDDQHAIADLICDLGHLADQRGLDFQLEVQRGIGHWFAEKNAAEGLAAAPEAAVQIIICRRAG
jgi:hypothetical protein